MRAAQFRSPGGPDVLEIVEVPDPHPGPGEIRIVVRATGINPIDWKFRQGMMGGELPSGTGYEAAGVVDELGEGVEGVAVGDQVFGQGHDVLTIADFAGAQENGVRVTGGPGTEMSYEAIREIVPVIEAGQFSLPVSRMFPLDEIAEAHRVSEGGHARGKLVLVVD